jgi:hypothetical protein
VSLDVRNVRKLMFELEGGAQSFQAQRVWRLEHQECMLNVWKQALEILRGSNDRVAWHYESLDGRVGGYPQGAVNTRSHQNEECSGEITSRSQNDQENLNEPFRNRRTQCHEHLPMNSRRNMTFSYCVYHYVTASSGLLMLVRENFDHEDTLSPSPFL